MIDLVACAILVWVIVADLRHFRIENGAVLLLAFGFILACFLRGEPALLVPHFLFALAAFIFLCCAFAARMIGGGDAKLLTAAMFWVGPEGAFVFATCLLTLAGLYVLGAKLGRLPARQIGNRLKVPFGPSIAGAWIAVIALSALLRPS